MHHFCSNTCHQSSATFKVVLDLVKIHIQPQASDTSKLAFALAFASVLALVAFLSRVVERALELVLNLAFVFKSLCNHRVLALYHICRILNK